jgi:hypothetical protein
VGWGAESAGPALPQLPSSGANTRRGERR